MFRLQASIFAKSNILMYSSLYSLHVLKGLKSFTPEMEYLSPAFGSKPRWESYSNMVERAREWLSQLDVNVCINVPIF